MKIAEKLLTVDHLLNLAPGVQEKAQKKNKATEKGKVRRVFKGGEKLFSGRSVR